MVPFRGGLGPLCGGAATAAGGRCRCKTASLHLAADPAAACSEARGQCNLVGALDIDLCKRRPARECRWSADLGSLMGMEGDTPTSGGGSPHAVPQPVFPLPPEYEEAKERRVTSVVELRNAVKTVRASLAIRSSSCKAVQNRSVRRWCRKGLS